MPRDRQAQLEAGSSRGNAPLAASVGLFCSTFGMPCRKPSVVALHCGGWAFHRDAGRRLFETSIKSWDSSCAHSCSMPLCCTWKAWASRSAGSPLPCVYTRKLPGSLVRIRQTITTNLRSGNLVLIDGDKVGLPAWKAKK